MEINRRNYDLNKQSKEISREEIVGENQNYANIFDELDKADGKIDKKLNRQNIINIFKSIVNIDKNGTDRKNSISDKEFQQLKQTLIPNVKVSLNEFKGFMSKLLNLNEQHYINSSLGNKRNGVRTIHPNNIAIRESRHGNVPLRNVPTNIDERIGGFQQGQRGDCYLLAEINAIKNTDNGADVFKKNIEKMSDGSAKITFPGALKVKKNLIAQYPDKKHLIEITGKYHVTKAALNKACNLAGDTYSKGDPDVILIEIAFESYRMELSKTCKNLGIKPNPNRMTAESNTADNNTDIISGGFSHDAGFILTGETSDVYVCRNWKYQNVKPYVEGEYGFITREEMEERCNTISKKGTEEVHNLSHSETSLLYKLYKYAGKEDKYALTFSVRVGKDGPDGSTKAGGGHALTVVRITKDTVYVLNPWNKDVKGNPAIEPIPIFDFIKMTKGFTAHEIKPQKETTTSTQFSSAQIQDIFNKINNKK